MNFKVSKARLRLPRTWILRFPGSAAAYNALLEVVDAELLSKAMAWVATTPSAQDASYNVSNGDLFRWWATPHKTRWCLRG